MAANQVIDNTTNKYAFGLNDYVKDFAKAIGAKHFMNHKVWQPEVWKAFSDPIGEIHFLLDGIDDTLINMNNQPWRSGINWELNLLYDMKAVFERTIFYYYGESYIGLEVFSKVKPL